MVLSWGYLTLVVLLYPSLPDLMISHRCPSCPNCVMPYFHLSTPVPPCRARPSLRLVIYSAVEMVMAI